MNITKTSNPTLGKNAFANEPAATNGEVMTMKGAINKTIILFGILLVSAILSCRLTLSGEFGLNSSMLIASSIGAFIIAIVTSFVKKASPITAPIYAALEGFVLGSISSLFEIAYGGIVFQAITLTLLVFGLMLFLYKTGILKASNKFVKGVVIATSAIAIFYFISIIVSLFTPAINNFLWANPIIGIIVSVIIVAVAALNLILDFSSIESYANSGSPKYMEWYAGFGLMVTLVWLYIEILRLLSYFRRN